MPLIFKKIQSRDGMAVYDRRFDFGAHRAPLQHEIVQLAHFGDF
jgi:hypothetical protein